MPEDVEIAIIRANFEEDVVWPEPLVEHLPDRVLVRVQPKAHGPLVRLPPRIAFDRDPHIHIFAQGRSPSRRRSQAAVESL